MALRLPYVGIDPANRPDPPDMQAERLAALERECARQAATIKALEQTMVVVSKLVSGYAQKATGR